MPEVENPSEWEIAVNIRHAIRAARRYRTPEMRDALIALLRHPGREVRLAAVGGLVSQQDPAAIPALQGAIDDLENPREVVDAAKSAIKQLEALEHPAAPDLEPRRLRRDLAEAAGATPARRELLQQLTAALRDPAAKVRSRTAKAVGALGDKRAAPALASLLQDPVSGVRQAAAMALGALKSRKAVPALMHYIRESTDIAHDLPALCALRDIGDPRALPAVLHALEHGPFFLAGLLARDEVVARLTTRENISLLHATIARMEAARSRDAAWESLQRALQHIYAAALGRVATRDDLPELLALFERAPADAQLAKALVRLAEPSLLEPMRRLLLAGHQPAADVLIALGAAGLPALKEALRYPDAGVRRAVVLAMFERDNVTKLRPLDDAELLHLLTDIGAQDPLTSMRLHAKATARRLRRRS